MLPFVFCMPSCVARPLHPNHQNQHTHTRNQKTQNLHTHRWDRVVAREDVKRWLHPTDSTFDVSGPESHIGRAAKIAPPHLLQQSSGRSKCIGSSINQPERIAWRPRDCTGHGIRTPLALESAVDVCPTDRDGCVVLHVLPASCHLAEFWLPQVGLYLLRCEHPEHHSRRFQWAPCRADHGVRSNMRSVHRHCGTYERCLLQQHVDAQLFARARCRTNLTPLVCEGAPGRQGCADGALALPLIPLHVACVGSLRIGTDDEGCAPALGLMGLHEAFLA